MTRLSAGSLILPLLITGAAMANPPTPGPAPAGTVDVAVEPFSRLGSDEVPAWVGPAVQENLVSDLARLHFRPHAVAVATADHSTTQPAPPAATDGAPYVIRGSYQATGDSIRFDGQVVTMADNQVMGGFSATGAVRDLFGLEDAVSAQAIHQLRHLTAPADAPAPISNQALASAVQPPSAAPSDTDGYDGSVLQAYVNSNSAPSNDYVDQENASRVRQTYFNDFSTGLGGYGGYGGFGPGVFYGTSFYPFGFGGLGYGSFGYGGLGFSGLRGGLGLGGGRFGYAGQGRGISFGQGGNFGYGFGGGGGFVGNGFSGGGHGSGFGGR